MTKEGVEAVKKGMRKSILNAVFMAVILVLTLLAVFKGEDLGKIGQCLLMGNLGSLWNQCL